MDSGLLCNQRRMTSETSQRSQLRTGAERDWRTFRNYFVLISRQTGVLFWQTDLFMRLLPWRQQKIICWDHELQTESFYITANSEHMNWLRAVYQQRYSLQRNRNVKHMLRCIKPTRPLNFLWGYYLVNMWVCMLAAVTCNILWICWFCVCVWRGANIKQGLKRVGSRVSCAVHARAAGEKSRTWDAATYFTVHKYVPIRHCGTMISINLCRINYRRPLPSQQSCMLTVSWEIYLVLFLKVINSSWICPQI